MSPSLNFDSMSQLSPLHFKVLSLFLLLLLVLVLVFLFLLLLLIVPPVLEPNQRITNNLHLNLHKWTWMNGISQLTTNISPHFPPIKIHKKIVSYPFILGKATFIYHFIFLPSKFSNRRVLNDKHISSCLRDMSFFTNYISN